MLRAVLFDVDGTLVDSVDQHARAWQEAFAHFGKRFSFEEVRSQIGKGGDQLIPHFLSKAEQARFGKALEAWRGEHYQRVYLPHIQAFPRVRELFERVLAEGLKVGLASSCKGEELEHNLKAARIEDLLDEATTSEDAERSKPHPDIFEAALSKLGVSAGEAIVVGDTPYDVEAARRAGLPCVGVLCGGFPEASLREAGAVAIYRDPAHLLAEFDHSPLARGDQRTLPDSRS